MGFFSWITSDTHESISNVYSVRGALPVYLIAPDGTTYYEPNYEGYGVFAGQDAYALLAQWNCPEKCTGDVEQDRLVGIYLREDDLKYPLKFAELKHLDKEVIADKEQMRRKYNRLGASDECPDQGFFYSDDEEDDDWDEEDDEY